jgi:hypothetical protein
MCMSTFGQESLTDAQVIAAINRASTGKRHQVGLSLNDKQTALLSGLVCETCQTSGYTIFVYTPESWIELQAIQARREMMPFGFNDVTPELRLPYIHIMALPSKADYLNGSGIAMASSVHRVVLSSTDKSEVVQPLSESHDTVESNSALRSFTQASAGAVFSTNDVNRLRSRDSKHEFFIVVVGDNSNKYFKVKARFFNQLFGKSSETEEQSPETSRAEVTNVEPTNTPVPARPQAMLPVAKTNVAAPVVAANSGVSIGAETQKSTSDPQNGAVLFGFAVTNSAQGGAEIVRITPDGPAERAGLRVGYVIRSVNGSAVRSASDLSDALGNRAPGPQIRVTYLFHTNLGWMPGNERILSLNNRSN